MGNLKLTPEQVKKFEMIHDPRCVAERRAQAEEIQKRVRHALFHEMGFVIDGPCIVDNTTDTALICGALMRMLADMVMQNHLASELPLADAAEATCEALHDLFCGKLVAYISENVEKYGALEEQLRINRESHD